MAGIDERRTYIGGEPDDIPAFADVTYKRSAGPKSVSIKKA